MSKTVDSRTPSTVPKLHKCAMAINGAVVGMFVVCVPGFLILSLRPTTTIMYADRFSLLFLITALAGTIMLAPSVMLSVLTHDPMRHYRGIIGKLVIPIFMLWILLVKWVFTDMKEEVIMFDMRKKPYPQSVSDTIRENFAAFEWLLQAATLLSILCFATIAGYYFVLRRTKRI